MPSSVTTYFKIEEDKFQRTGAFDSILDIDTRLFIDPFLLPHTSAPELKKGREKILKHFSEVLTLLANSQSKKDATWRAAERLLYFPEAKGFNFGYGGEGSAGSGMGPVFRQQLLETASEIVQKGIKDPVIFELVGIFEEGIGCDRISDMCCRILFPEFLAYSQRIFQELGIRGFNFKFRDQDFSLPLNPFRSSEPIILAPKDILRDLPLANDWSDISYVCSTNSELRDRLSSLIGSDWQDRTKGIRKRELKKLLLENPPILREFLASYEEAKPVGYDYASDPTGEASWFSISNQYARAYPLSINVRDLETKEDLQKVVNSILEKFQQIIEFNGLNDFLFRDDGKPKREEAAQLLFYAISSIYCDANSLAIARESNAGRGPVDFKIANGRINIVVDLKLSTNSHLTQAYEKQIPIYEKAEGSSGSIIVILKVKEKASGLEKLLKRKRDDSIRKKQTPEIFVIDATRKPSASKA